MKPLSASELARIQKNLERRFMSADKSSVVAIGFGRALKGGEHDPNRPFVVTFFVRRKLKRPAQESRLPDVVTVRIKRRGRLRSIQLPTDVVRMPEITRTGLRVTNFGSLAMIGTVGAVLTWREDTTQKWGLLTAGHFLPDPIGIDAIVDVRSKVGTLLLRGSVYKKSVVADRIDGAIIRTTPEDLLAAGIILNQNVEPQTVWPRDQLVADLQNPSIPIATFTGDSLTTTGAKPFVVDHYIPEIPAGYIQGMGRLRDMVFVRSTSGSAAFTKGTSGSCWRILAINACLQVGADEDTFSIGVGQILDSIFAWAETALTDDPDIQATDVTILASF